MTNERPQRRLFRLLRRTVKDESTKTFQDDHALWLAHERAVGHVRDVADALGKMMSGISRQRTAIDTALDRGRRIGSRAIELEKQAVRDAETFERLSLVALNAGLEGARLGENAGHPLSLVSEEVRAHSTRGGESIRELIKGLSELQNEVKDLDAQLERVRDTANDASLESTRATGSASALERTLTEVKERLRKTTGSDPETMRTIAEAAEHARALVGALGTLSGKVPQALLVGTLRPLLEPLVRLLSPDDHDDGDSA